MDYLWIVLVVGAFAAFFLWWKFVRTPKKKKEFLDRIIDNIGYDVPFQWTESDFTPIGCSVVWNGDPFGSEAAKQLVFNCLDVGVRNAFNAMREKFPTWDFDSAFAVYAFLDGNYDSVDIPDTKIFKLRDNRTVAGFTIGTGEGYPMLLMVLPVQKHVNWANTVFTALVAWYEREHNMEFRSDGHEFIKGSGRADGFPDIHPHHLPDGFIPEPAPAPLPALHALKSRAQMTYEKMSRKIKCGLSFSKFAPRSLKSSLKPIPSILTPYDIVPRKVAERYVKAQKNTIAGK